MTLHLVRVTRQEGQKTYFYCLAWWYVVRWCEYLITYTYVCGSRSDGLLEPWHLKLTVHKNVKVEQINISYSAMLAQKVYKLCWYRARLTASLIILFISFITLHGWIKGKPWNVSQESYVHSWCINLQFNCVAISTHNVMSQLCIRFIYLHKCHCTILT